MTSEQLQDIVWVYGLIAMLVHDKLTPQADEKKIAESFDELRKYVWMNRGILADGAKGIKGDFVLNGGDGRKLVIELKIGLEG